MKFIGFAVRGGKTNKEKGFLVVFLCSCPSAQGMQTLFSLRFFVVEQEP